LPITNKPTNFFQGKEQVSIQKVLSLNLGWDTDYINSGVTWFSSVLPG